MKHLQDITAFTKAMAEAGLQTSNNIIADGQLHRFHVEGDKKRSRNGWYVFFNGHIAAGAFGSWKTGQSQKWCSVSKEAMTSQEWHNFQAQLQKARQQRDHEQQLLQEKAQARASRIWEKAQAVTNHAYLVKKRVNAHQIRTYKGLLVIPVRSSSGQLMSLQFINPNGEKYFLAGGRVAGGFHQIGKPTWTLYIAEGYATGATLHELTHRCVLVAFNKGNLGAVTASAHELYPDSDIVIAADNDQYTQGNPGVSAAIKAAIKHDCKIIIPPVAGDWNDYFTGAAA